MVIADRKKGYPSLQKPALRLLITVSLLFVTALGLRLYHIDQPPADFAATRQYHSAILARGFYFEELETAPEWKKDIASLNKQMETIIEPPVLELASSFAYRALGGEYLWFPRLLSVVFWLVGGVFVYLIARKIGPPVAAVFSTAFYLLLPYGILASRSFQPDPLMVMMLLASILTIVRYYEQPSSHRLVIMAFVSALAVLVKPGICFFQIFGAFVALGIYRRGTRRTLTGRNLPIFAVLSLLPVGLYYLYGTLVAGFLQGEVQAKVMPHLLVQPTFWALWFKQVVDVVGGFAGFAPKLQAATRRGGLFRAEPPLLVSNPDFWCKAL